MTSKPRIYIVIGTFHPIVGGAEKQALIQGRSLIKRGIETTIVTFRHDKTWLSHEVIDGVPITRVAGTILGGREKLPKLFQKLFYMVALLIIGWTLWRQRKHYDILHLYQLTLLAVPTALVSRLTGKPMIVAIRNAGLDTSVKSYNSALLVAGPLDSSTPWLQVHGRIPVGGDLTDLERMGKHFVRFTHALLQSVQAVAIVLSSRMEHYLTSHDFALSRTWLIPNGVDLTRFMPCYTDDPQKKDAAVVVCVSRLCYQKGIDVLLQAWNLVRQEVPEARLIIVGIGPIQAQLQSMAQALGIMESVEFAGLQSDVAAQLHRGSLGVLPSRLEGMPNTVLEAMACGLPCVATRVSGSEDIIQHRVSGLLVEPEDYQELAQALLTLLRNPELVQQYGRAARATVEKRYSIEYIIDTYVELYQSLVHCRKQVSGNTQSSEIDTLPSP